MSFMDEYNALKKKRKEEEESSSGSSSSKKSSGSFMDEYNSLKAQRQEDTGLTTLPFIVGKDSATLTKLPFDPRKDSATLTNLPYRVGKDEVSPITLPFYSRTGVTKYGNEKSVAQTILGSNEEEEARDANFWDVTWRSLKQGYYNSRYGEETFADMYGQANEKQKYEDILAGDEYKFVASNLLEEGVSGAFQQLGQQLRQWTNPRTVAFAGAAAGAAAIAGQVGPQVLVPEEVVTVPGAFLTGIAAGSAASNLEIEAGFAYNEMLEAGISEETAKKIATGVGVANAGLELVQLDELVDAYKITKATGATKNFTQKLADELLDRGIDVAKETAQEVAQEGVTIAGTQAASKIDKGEWAYTAGEVGERLGDTALSSALSFGMLNVPAAVSNISSISAQEAAANKLTENEQKVVDKVYNDLVAEKEEKGTVSAREKKKIYESVLKKMEKGYISTDIIEEVLGGEAFSAYKGEVNAFFESDNYKAYKDTITSEEEQIKDIEAQMKELEEAPNTIGNAKKYESLQSQIDDIKNTSKRNELKALLDQEAARIGAIRNDIRKNVSGMVKDSRLYESYNELIRSHEKFTADVNKYEDENARKTIQNIIDSGVAVNTNEFHEFADWLAKISADKGITFSMTDTERLKGTRYYFEGKVTNGFLNENGDVMLNVDSDKAGQITVGHEITHVLEGTKFYSELQEAIKNYAIAKEGLDAFNTRLKETEARYKGINDPDKELTADLIGEYLFTDPDFIYRLSTENRALSDFIFDEIKYLCRVVTAGSKEARDLERIKKAFEDAYRASGKVNTKTNTTTENASEQSANNNQTERNGFVGSYTGTQYNASQAELLAAVSTEGIQNATDLASRQDISFNHIGISDNETRQKWIEAGLAYAEQDAEGDEIFFVNEAMLMDERERRQKAQKSTGNNGVKHSLSDSTGREITKEQQDYFKDSVVRDENGNLKVMYHGTPNGDFTVFKEGTYFTDNKEYADTYQNPGASSISAGKTATNPKTFEVYLDIKKPFDLSDPEARDIYINDYIKGGNAMGINPYLSDADYAKIDTIDWTEGEDLREFLIDNGYDYDGLVLDEGGTGGYGDEVKSRGKSYVVFSPEQVKKTDNLKPTNNPDIRFSLSDAETDKAHAEAVNNRDWETAQRLVDEAAAKAGYTKAVYHGTESRFTVFDTDEESTTRPQHAWMADYPDGTIFLAEDYDVAGYYGDRVMPLYLDTTDMKVFEEPDMYAHRAMDDKYGYEVYNYPVIAVKGKDMTIYATLDNTLVKYSDAATYDDNGELIPLSERFKHSNPDVRFSLSDAVEETKDLIAVHNLRGTELIKSLELGGLPMPSIAIIKEQASHDKYGDVSLILPKEAIDPKANRANKVYGGDAWTPTYPKIEYKPSEAVEQKVSDKYYELAEKFGYDAARPLYRFVYEMEDMLNREGGEASLLERLYDDTDLMQLFLQDSGKGKVEDVVKETVTKISEAEAEMNQFIVDALGVDLVTAFKTPAGENPMTHRKAYLAEHENEVREAYKRYFMEVHDFTEEQVNNVLSNTTQRGLMKIMRDAYQFTQNKGVTVRTETDYAETRKLIREAAADGYKQWIDSLFKGVEAKTGIRNNQEYFDRNGNRRSWDALHWENTLENVVKTMKAQNQTGADAIFAAHQINAVAAKQYGSIEDIKADSHRLQTIPEEQYEEIKESYENRFSEIAGRIMDKTMDNPFTAKEIAMESVCDAVRASKTPAGILSYLKRYSNVNVTAKDVADIVSLVNDIANMPTGYFEAKPQRAVGFDEVAVFVIPYDSDVKLKQELLNRGYAIAEYDPKVEGDRTRVLNQFEEYKFSLSNVGEETNNHGLSPLNKFKYQEAPVAENATTTEESTAVDNKMKATVSEMENVEELFPDNIAPAQDELERLEEERSLIYSGLESALETGNASEVEQLAAEYDALTARIRELEADENQRADSLTDADVPPEVDAPYTETTNAPVENPFDDRKWNEVTGTKGRSANAYMYEHPEVKPFFQEEAQKLLGELNDTIKGERFFNDQVYYESGGEKGITGVKRLTSKSMETLLDEWGMSYADIEKGLKAIIEDNGAENISAAKKIEFMLNDRLLNGYKNFYERGYIEPNQDYIRMLEERQINSYSKEAFDSFMTTADQYAPMEEVAPVVQTESAPVAQTVSPMETVNTDSKKGVVKGQQTYITTEDKLNGRRTQPGSENIAPIYESKDKRVPKGQTTMFEPPKPNPKVATVLTEESAIAKEKSGIGSKLTAALVDKGMVFENLSLKTGNHELQAKYNYALPSNTEARAQHFMEHGAKGVKSLKDIMKTVDKSGKTDDFSNYLYHVHNIDRMTLEDRFGVDNKTVYGETVTADVSRKKAALYEKKNPEFKKWAKDVYAYNKYLRKMLVDGNIISQETADLWEKMYPHYVPIRRVDSKGQNISVPLDTNKTGVNNPVKRATGGSSDIQPVFATMAQRTEQVYRAIARNSFGIELKNTLGTTINSEKNTTGVDEAVDTLVAQEDHLLKAGTMNTNPTFTVFENGERVEFEITEDMFDALKPAGDLLGHRSKAIGAVGDVRRNLLTVWNPVFALYRNPIKDLQDVAVNSQHPMRTYLNVPNAIFQMATGGDYANEYHQNGGKSNTYFDSRTNKFKAEDNIFKKTIGMPVRAIETAGEFIEEIPRLAEYIASRKNGRSVERSMLDAARVTTNFAAGGDFTKFLNSHGFTFLNASVQGASQHVRNFREAKQQGLKGYVKVLAKYAIAGLPAILLNNMVWDDDEEYEELSDYVKQNYYVVAKTEGGKFVRIPKGRTAAVMGELMNQMQNLVTGDDEVDFATFYELFMNNIAPNNPIENNILAPIGQVMKNEAWYGGDLVPTRLQDLPAAEQFDESTDSISKWLGEKTNTSPYKWNYLLDQYSGGLGDVFLPMLTPEAESGDNSFMGNMLAPWKKEITTDKVLNNKNPGDFYDLKDELEVKSNSRNATAEDEMRSMYMDSVSWEMGDLYAQKREVQNSDMPDDEKYETVREIQDQINEIAKNAMGVYDRVEINGLYSEVGDKRYNKDAESGKWYEIREKNSDGSDNYYYQKEQEVTKALGISYEAYWNNREEYNYAYDKPEQYALAKSVGGYQAYRGYTSELWDIKADKDENGKSINGSRKEKVIDYINNLDADYGEKLILFKSEYNADDTYNYEIIDYLNGRDDISYEEMETILKYIGFDVDSKGNISWD